MAGVMETVPLYLQGCSTPVFGVLHRPASRPRGTGVVFCAPFGWEEICSYRARREWAVRLAAAGHPTIRFDLPSTGDSAGMPQDPDRMGAWCAAIAAAAQQLREVGAEKVAAIGIGLGGLLLWRAICEGTPIDEAVLWGMHARGRALIRELQAFARLEDVGAEGEKEGPDATGADDLAAGGFVLSKETVAAIAAIDLRQMRPPEPLRRILLLDRDGMAPEQSLREHLRDNANDFSMQSGPGFGAMTAKPHLARAPLSVFATVDQWLHSEDPSAFGGSSVSAEAMACPQPSAAHTPCEIEIAPGVSESALRVEQPFGALFGVLCTPAYANRSGICVVLLNAAAIRRVGPNRMWVEAARRWASRGVPTFRLDLEGIGDADGDGERFDDLAELYDDSLVTQVRAAIDELEARGLGPSFVLGGLCSGACWSFHAALEDPRVVGALLLNPRALYWDVWLETARDLRRGVLRTSAWRKALRGQMPPARIAEAVARAPAAPLELARRALARSKARRSGVDRIGLAFDRLCQAGKPISLMFSADEPLLEELESDGYVDRLDRWPNIEIQSLPGSVHTLRPLQAQRAAHRAMDAAIDSMAQRFAAV